MSVSKIYKKRNPFNKSLLTLLSLSFLLTKFSSAQNPSLPYVAEGAIEIADFNGDNYPDLFLGGYDTLGNAYARIIRNNAGTSFTILSTPIPQLDQITAAWGDYDNDGDPDLAISGQSGHMQGTLEIWNNLGNDSFALSPISFPTIYYGEIFWRDFDRDGDVDLLATGFHTQRLSTTVFFRNDSNGVFTEIYGRLTNATATHIDIGDFDGDSLPDIAMRGKTEDNNNIIAIYHNQGSFFFDSISIPVPNPDISGLRWQDYDNDGDQDLIVLGVGSKNLNLYLLRNNNSNFIFTQELNAVSMADGCWYDFTGNNAPDLIISGTDRTGQPSSIFYNNSTSGLTASANPSGISPAVFLPIIKNYNYNLDAVPDIIVSGYKNDQRAYTHIFTWSSTLNRFVP